jgi:hypothetical protein
VGGDVDDSADRDGCLAAWKKWSAWRALHPILSFDDDQAQYSGTKRRDQ